MGTADEEDVVPTGEGGAARRADAEVALEADDDELCFWGHQVGEGGAGERVVLALVEDGLVRERLVNEGPARQAALVGIARRAALADVDMRGREGGGQARAAASTLAMLGPTARAEGTPRGGSARRLTCTSSRSSAREGVGRARPFVSGCEWLVAA